MSPSFIVIITFFEHKIGVALLFLLLENGFFYALLKTTPVFKILSCEMHKIKRRFGQGHKLLKYVRAKLVTVSCRERS